MNLVKCPFCESELLAYTVPSRLAQIGPSPVLSEDVVLDHCDACNAVWFDRGELSLVSGVEVSRLPFAFNDVRVRPMCRHCGADNVHGATVCDYCKEALYVLCSRCRGRLFRTNVKQTPVDTCFSCGGVWIADDVYEFLRSERLAWTVDGELTCTAFGRRWLNSKNSMMSENGPVCDRCGLAMQKKNMAQFATEGQDLRDASPLSDGFDPGSYSSFFEQLLAALFGLR